MDLKNVKRGRLEDLANVAGIEYIAGKRIHGLPVDIAMPCATQNELTGEDAAVLIHNGVKCVAEGANMPSTLDAVDAFVEAKILYAPGKASNAGGVATSGLEMSQNSIRLNWTHGEVDERLHGIMKDIHGNYCSLWQTRRWFHQLCEWCQYCRFCQSCRCNAGPRSVLMRSIQH